MAGQASAIRSTNVKSSELPAKVRGLVTRAPYAAPKVVSFPIDGLRVNGPVAFAGNGGGPV